MGKWSSKVSNSQQNLSPFSRGPGLQDLVACKPARGKRVGTR